ncbi:hypothetical protein IX51_08405 [uncultured archaeon]|nr:hypothetical protein IX51_08405 [uncultured archaeon]
MSIERSGSEVIAMDSEGRLLYFSSGSETWKRSLGNRYTQIGWEGEKRIIRKLSEEEGAGVYSKAMNFLREVSHEIDQADLSRAVSYILSKDEKWMAEDSRKFEEIYGGKFPIIPQDQRFSAYFQLTAGSTWNNCTFASPGVEISQRDEDDFISHINRVKDQFGKGMELRRGAFLGDVSALNSEQKPLLKAMDIIREQTSLPLYTFVEAFSVPKKKNMIHYQDMKRHGLSRVYVGVQSGSVSLLRHFEALKNVSEILNLVNNLKNSGISVGLIVLAGYGGFKHSNDHINETAAIISQMDLDEGDIIYISPMDEQDDPRYAALVKEGTFDVMDHEAMKDQADMLENKIKEEFQASNRIELKTQISRHDIREGIY